MNTAAFDRLIRFLNDLEQRNVSYTLHHHRDEAIMVLVAVPGERWEIEFLNDCSVEVERFISNGEIQGDEALSELFTRYFGQEDEVLESPQGVQLTVT